MVLDALRLRSFHIPRRCVLACCISVIGKTLSNAYSYSQNNEYIHGISSSDKPLDYVLFHGILRTAFEDNPLPDGLLVYT